jgi:hypothetical protein
MRSLFSSVPPAVAALGLSFACNSGSTAAPRSPDDDEAPNAAVYEDPAYRADIKLICDVDSLAHLENLDVLEAAQQRENYWVEHVKQPDAIYFLTVFRSKPDAERGELLLREARASHVDCPLGTALADAAPPHEK